jgi:DNA-binding NtrC family response regulator
MKSIFIVDKDSEHLAADLNSIAKRERLAFRFMAFGTPERFLRELETNKPDLVLLHHHWTGVRIAQLLQRIAEAEDTIRIVVFTGQSVDIAELIECVRFGVADYWTERGRLDHTVVFRKIEQYCHNSTWTIQSLRVPSGSLAQLLSEAENSIQVRAQLDDSVHELTNHCATSGARSTTTLRLRLRPRLNFCLMPAF